MRLDLFSRSHRSGPIVSSYLASSSQKLTVLGGGKAVRFQAGEASFSEQIAPNAHSPRRHAAPRTPIQSTVSATQLIVASFLLLIAILAYSPSFLSVDISLLPSSYAEATQQVIAAIWNLKHDEPPMSSTSVSTHAPAALESIAREAALLTRWGVLRPDYALQAHGGRILLDLTASRQDQARSRSTTPTVGPEVVIDEDLTIGRCWSTAPAGQVGFSTPTLIYPQFVTIDHIPRQLSLDIGCAPRRMVLWGVLDGIFNFRRFQSLSARHLDLQAPFNLTPRGRNAPSVTGDHAFVVLAAIEYDIGGDWPTQTFPIFDHILESRMDFGVFVLEVVDNWGSVDTCLYRVRIHGEPAEIISQGKH